MVRTARSGSNISRRTGAYGRTNFRAPEQHAKSVSGTRRALLRKFPFLVVFRESRAIIEIIAVAHGRRKPGYWKSRVE